jgi:outer membrane protease
VGQGTLKTESKVQVKTTISSASKTAHYDWVLKNASVLREWAKWSDSV